MVSQVPRQYFVMNGRMFRATSLANSVLQLIVYDGIYYESHSSISRDDYLGNDLSNSLQGETIKWNIEKTDQAVAIGRR